MRTFTLWCQDKKEREGVVFSNGTCVVNDEIVRTYKDISEITDNLWVLKFVWGPKT